MRAIVVENKELKIYLDLIAGFGVKAATRGAVRTVSYLSRCKDGFSTDKIYRQIKYEKSYSKQNLILKIVANLK